MKHLSQNRNNSSIQKVKTGKTVYLVKCCLFYEPGCYETFIVGKYSSREQAGEIAAQLSFETGRKHWVVCESK